jgi:hypothetical protein
MSLLQPLSIQLARAIAQALRSLLWCNITLWLCHHLITNQELAHSGASQQWRVEVHVEVRRLDLFVSAR